MSRVNYNEDGDWLEWGRWERNSETTVKSKRGQRILRELEEALVSMPEPRLFSDVFAYREQGDEGGRVEACVLGAYALYKGKPIEELERLDGDSEEQLRYVERDLGMTYTMAWNLMELNDERYARLTPEERHAKMLTWVRERIISGTEASTTT